MCLIALKDGKDAIFTENQYRRMITANADGLGIMYRENGRVIVEKSVRGDKQKFKLWNRHKHRDTYAMHSRLRTHGAIDLANCHPYEILNIDKGDPIDLYMMHNGVIRNEFEIDKTMSDTWNFIECIIKPLAKANIDLIWDNKAIQGMIDKMIGYNKLLFMRSDKDQCVLIFNKQQGDTITGCWLSNLHSTGDTRPFGVTTTHNVTKSNTHSSVSNVRLKDLSTSQWWNKTIEYNRKQDITEDNIVEVNGSSTIYTKSELESEWEEGIYGGNYSLQNISSSSRSSTAAGTPMNLLNPPDATEIKSLIFRPEPAIILPKQRESHLETMLQVVQTMSDVDMKHTLLEDPQEFATIIGHFSNTCSLKYQEIIDKICDHKEIDEIVNIIRQISHKERHYAA